MAGTAVKIPVIDLFWSVLFASTWHCFGQTYEAMLELNPYCSSMVPDGQGYARIELGRTDGQYNLTFSGVDMVNMVRLWHIHNYRGES
jgi:hypothetical protein